MKISKLLSVLSSLKKLAILTKLIIKFLITEPIVIVIWMTRVINQQFPDNTCPVVAITAK